MRQLIFAGLSFVALLSSVAAAEPVWNPSPWLDDLAQIRSAIDRDYPNRDWLVREREAPLDRWFARAAAAIKASRNDAEARQALDNLVERFNDGHVALRWPRAVAAASPAAQVPATIAAFCAARGYDVSQVTAGTAAGLPGYRLIDSGGPFAAGTIEIGRETVGIVRIGVFSPHGYPSACEQAVAATRIQIDKPCDAVCEDRVLTEAYALMTRGLMATLERLRSAGAQTLLVDLTRNGGGSDWTEAAARIVSPVPLRSAALGVLRNEAWVRRWQGLAAMLRKEAQTASPADRETLQDLAQQADTAARDAAPCPGTSCSRLAPAGYAGGLIAELPAGAFDGKAWGPYVFNPAQFPYRDGVWKGPVIVLVDDETWSAAEQFAALLQDNGAAIIMGTRTGGAGCGRLHGAAPITLAHSKAQLDLPNCARFRKDGSNEVGGVVPDVLTGVRWNDGPGFAGRFTAAKLAEAVNRARALSQR